jgi:hypothetical protein
MKRYLQVQIDRPPTVLSRFHSSYSTAPLTESRRLDKIIYVPGKQCEPSRAVGSRPWLIATLSERGAATALVQYGHREAAGIINYVLRKSD